MRDKRRAGRHVKADEHIVRRVIQACKSKPFESSVLLTREINQNPDEQKQISNTTFNPLFVQRNFKFYTPFVCLGA